MKNVGGKQIKRRQSTQIYKKSLSKSQKESDEIEEIVGRYEDEISNIKSFSDMPLSKRTLQGLQFGGYKEPTEIQRETIGLALRGLDILGAAKTGSGKTLAFLIPILECLWRNRWSKVDGLGALIISPTRELSYQTFEVLRKIGKKHDFSAALLIGGTDVEYEKSRIADKNIVICTPGRLLQHMDENAFFQCLSLNILVLDEADRILDLGFEKQINAVIENLPAERQTLLFSATQTKSVKALARLSLHDPVYVSVHEHSTQSTPEQLIQSYIICEDHEKVNTLWSFLKNHRHKKILVFMTTCKQVRFIYESFRRLRPGLIVLALYGSLSQSKRMSMYQQFCDKDNAVLFATDIAARGLDFPAVDWVMQMDCPCDADEYIHRCGRTARYQNKGEALLVLTPSQEKPMLLQLDRKKVPINKIDVNSKKLVDISGKMESECVQDPNLKIFAQRFLVAYLRSIFLMKNKDVFDVQTIDVEKMAKSFGLAIAPRIRFLQKQEVKSKKRKDDVDLKNEQDILSVKKKDIFNISAKEEEADSMQSNVLWKSSTNLEDQSAKSLGKVRTKASIAKKALKKKILLNQKIVFDDNEDTKSDISDVAHDLLEDQSTSGLNIAEAKEAMLEADKADRQIQKAKLKTMRQEKKRKTKMARERKKRRKVQNDDREVVLAGSDSGESMDLSFVPDPDKPQRIHNDFDDLRADEQLAKTLLENA